jgi:hypothetical protein
MTEIPQAHALRLQLVTIAGKEPAGSLFEIRSRIVTGGMRQTFVPIRERDRAVKAIINGSRIGDVYIGAAPRVRESGTADAVERVHCLWCDCDGPEAVDMLRGFEPLPSIVVRSSGTPDRVHAWWPLKVPLTPAQAVRANRRLALALGADRASTDAARVMRPAGSLNHKHDPARLVECVRLELTTFKAAQVVGGLDDDPRYVPRPTPPAPRVVDGGSALAGLVRVVREAEVGQRNHKLNWAAYRAGEHAAEGTLDADQARAELLVAALDAGLSEPEALRTITSGLGATERLAA